MSWQPCDFLANKTLSRIGVAIPVDWVILHWYSCGADGRSLARSVYGHVITKFSWMGSLPHFITHGAPLRASRARAPLKKWKIPRNAKTGRFEVAPSSSVVFPCPFMHILINFVKISTLLGWLPSYVLFVKCIWRSPLRDWYTTCRGSRSEAIYKDGGKGAWSCLKLVTRESLS